MSFIVECNSRKIEVDHVINGMILFNDAIIFNAVLVDGDAATITICSEDKGYREALKQIREIEKKLKGINSEKEKLAPKQKYKWGEWKKEGMIYVDPFTGIPVSMEYSVRTNGKRIEVKFGFTKGSASCNTAEGDKFDYEYGKALAIRRMIANFVVKRANDLDAFQKEYELMNKYNGKK